MTDLQESSVQVAEPQSVPASPSAPSLPEGISPETLQAWLSGQAPESLFEQHPGLKRFVEGRTGELADRIARQRVESQMPQLLERAKQQWETEREYAGRLARREEILRNRDAPAAISELAKDHENEVKYLDQQAAKARETDVSNTTARAMWNEAMGIFHAAPMAVQKALEKKTYPTDPVKAVTEFYSDLARETAKVNAEELASLKTKDLEAALRKQILAERNGSEPRANTGSGGSPRGELNDSEWQQNRGNMSWVKENADRIRSAAVAGRIAGGRAR